jgi:hypothetical protein
MGALFDQKDATTLFGQLPGALGSGEAGTQNHGLDLFFARKLLKFRHFWSLP